MKIDPKTIVINRNNTSQVNKKLLEKSVISDQTDLKGSSSVSSVPKDITRLTIVEDNFSYDRIIEKFIGNSTIVSATNGSAYLKLKDKGNEYLLKIGSNRSNLFIRKEALKQNITLRERDMKEVNDTLLATAEIDLVKEDVFLRVALIEGGIEIDLGNDDQTRMNITKDQTEIINNGSSNLFYRSSVSKPFSISASTGDFNKVDKYLSNLKPELRVLLKAWVSYTLAHPKVSSTNFVHLVLLGAAGSGKSFLCRLLQNLIDPSAVSLQVLPRNTKDLIVAAQNSHLLIFDNIRKLSQQKSDDLCVAATGGSLSSKKLYTDDDQNVSHLHVALILNGIFDFVTESDLASRSLVLNLHEMNADERVSETTLERNLNQDLPSITQGLFETISRIFAVLPKTQVIHPERMIDFSQWLAAIEILDGAELGTYQKYYSDTLKEAQLNTLIENEFSGALYRFSMNLNRNWRGTAQHLLNELNHQSTPIDRRSSSWPKSPESIGRRLRNIKTAFSKQGVYLEFIHSNDRFIEISTDNIEDAY